jgi:hypothetical protein
MAKQDKIVTLFGVALNVFVVTIILIGATYYIA